MMDTPKSDGLLSENLLMDAIPADRNSVLRTKENPCQQGI